MTLFEKADKLDRMVTAVSKMPRLYMRDLNNVVDWQKTQLNKLSVKLNLGQEATPDAIHALGPKHMKLKT